MARYTSVTHPAYVWPRRTPSGHETDVDPLAQGLYDGGTLSDYMGKGAGCS